MLPIYLVLKALRNKIGGLGLFSFLFQLELRSRPQTALGHLFLHRLFRVILSFPSLTRQAALS